MKSNINKIYALSALHGFILFYSFDKVFLQLRGLSLTQVVAIEIIFIVTTLATEVPSGALSDRWSRKYVLSLSGLFFSLYVFLFAAGNSFLIFSLGAFVAGFGATFLSGTDTSILFDSLKELKLDDDYEKYLGRKRAVGAVTFIVASSIGGIVGELYSLEVAIWLSLPSMILASLIPLTLQEPTFHRSTGEVKYWQHIKETLAFLVAKPPIVYATTLVVAVMVPALIVDEYAQTYYAFLGIGAIGLGVLGSVSGFFDAVFNTITFWFKRFKHSILFGVMLLIFTAGLLSSWLFQNWIGLLLLIVGSLAFYVIEIIAMADINRQISSKIRATTESFFSLATQVVYLPTVFSFGYVSQKYSPATGFALLAGLLATYSLLYWVFVRRMISSVHP